MSGCNAPDYKEAGLRLTAIMAWCASLLARKKPLQMEKPVPERNRVDADGSGSRDSLADRIVWSGRYRADWDDAPEHYLLSGILPENRSRRLGMIAEPGCRFRAYIGVQHYDPLQWGRYGTARTTFWVSVLSGTRTVTMRSCTTMAECLEIVRHYYRTMCKSPDLIEVHAQR